MSGKNQKMDAGGETLVSVVIPLFNCERFIGACIRSVYAQPMTGIQIIVADDVSTDTSFAAAEAVRAECPVGMELEIFTLSRNGGVGVARNAAVERAKGKYLLFIDGDDELVAGSLPALLGAAEEHQAEVSCGTHVCFRGAEEFEDLRPTAQGTRLFSSAEEVLQGYCTQQFPFYTWNKLLLRSFAVESGLHFEEAVRHDEDQLWCFRLALRATRWINVSTCTYRYRKDNPGSVTANALTQKRMNNYYGILAVMEKELGLFDPFPAPQAAWVAKAMLNFTKSILWHVELVKDAGHRELYRQFRHNNVVRLGKEPYRHLGLRDKVFAFGWRLPYPFCRAFSPCLIAKARESFSLKKG